MSRSPECRCESCWGLAEYMENLTGRDYGLARAPGCAARRSATLRVLTFGRPDEAARVIVAEPTCDESMTCPCDRCADERALRAKVIKLRRDAADPLRPRPPRYSAAGHLRAA